MAGGFGGGGLLGGALLGGVVSLGVGGVASVMVPLAPAQAPVVSDMAPSSVDVPAVSDAPVPQAEVSESAPKVGQNSAQVTAPEQDSLDGVDAATVAIANAPSTDVVANLVAPAEVPQTGAVPLTQEDPVFPNPQALAPMLPQEADGVAIDTAPADPPQPQVEVSDAVREIIEDLQPAQVREVAPTAPVIAGGGEEAGEPTAALPIEQADQPEEQATADQTGQQATADQTGQVELIPVEPPASVLPAAPETAQTDETPEAVPEDPAEEAPQVAMLVPSARPQIGTPAVPLTERNTGVTVNRLGNSAASRETEEVTVISQDGATTTGGDPRPLKRYGQPFANAENKPLMSIVLIDDGSNPTSGAPGIAALRSFPYSLSFAVDSNLPDAKERMELYRSEGFEVLAMVDMPQGAQATDVETTLGVTLSQMREVVGLLEGDGAGLQSSREVSDQVTAILAQSGHGLVTMDKGLNTMPKLARKEGVPADPVFRDFDSKGQTATVIRRFLDQAAFKAGQEGAVIMLGRLRPDTISALLLWGLQDRAGQVALAPISALLMRDGG